MLTTRLGAEEVARLFHDTYERLAPHFGYETREETRIFDPASKNGLLMIAVCEELACKLMDNRLTRLETEIENINEELKHAPSI